MKSDMSSSASLHVDLANSDKGKATKVLKHLAKVAGEATRHRKLGKEEVTARGYPPQTVEFPHDGYIPPYVDGMLEDLVTGEGGDVKSGLRLRKILVAHRDDDIHVTRAEFENLKTGTTESVAIRSLYLSLGPSMRTLNLVSAGTNVKKNLLEHMMWASGSSIVLMVKVDKEKVAKHKMVKFRDHIDAHNKHVVRLAEREVVNGDRKYQIFALQATGGGHFPMKNVHPETAVNILKANVVPLLGLDVEQGVEWDIVSVRSCARGVTAQNVFRITAPASNMVMIYGLGGMGLTTMAPNALLMKAVMEARQQLSRGEISCKKYAYNLRTSDFSHIPHWNAPNPFSGNYSKFVDNVGSPLALARYFKRATKMLKLVTI